MGRKITEAEYIQSLEGRDIEYAGGYTNALTKCLHRCKIDGYEWKAAPGHIRHGTGCPKCGRRAAGAKQTVPVAEYICSLEGRDIEYISGYVKANVKCLHRCKIDGHQWEVTPNDLRRGRGCPKCGRQAQAASKTRPFYSHVQSLKGRTIEYVSGYVNSTTPCLHRCKIDGYEWAARPASVQRGSGCPKCGDLRTAAGLTRPLDEYIQSLDGTGIEYAGGYVNTKVKCLHRCKIDGYEWEVAPYSIKSGTGCPKCAKYGFQLDLPGTLYFLIAPEGYFKIGITGVDIKRRFGELKRYTPFDFTLYSQYKADGVTIAALEKSLHRRLKKHHAGLTGFDGATEWFHANREVLELVNRVLETGSLKKPLPQEVKHVRREMPAVHELRA